MNRLLNRVLAGVAGMVSLAVVAATPGIEANTLEVSLAVGYGHVNSPVEGESDLTFHVLPDIVWYGERAYFDNGLFGYALTESAHQQWDLVLYPNEDGLIFNLSGGTASLLINRPFDPAAPVVVIAPIERRISGMAGLRYNQQGETFSGYVELAGDVTGIHHGWELGTEFGLAEPLQWHSLLINAFVGIRFKDADLVDYYYTPQLGEITPPEGDQLLLNGEWVEVGPFEGERGWLAHLQLDIWLPLAEQWALRATVRQNHYSDSIADSVVIKQARFSAGFFGIEYRF